MASLLRQIVVLAALAGGAGWAIQTQFPQEAAGDGEARKRPPVSVAVAEARAGEVERVVSAIGTGRALRSVELRFTDTGRVSEILFDDGDAVEAGAVLARLDDAAEQAALAEASAALEEAQAAFERAEALREQGRVTTAAFDVAAGLLKRARARKAAAEADLDGRYLRAPFDGVVGFAAIDPGAVVSSGANIATLDDISELEVQFAVPERHFGEVAVGRAVRATTSIFPDESFLGEVRSIDRRVDELSRAFRVRARFPNNGLRLPAGAFMQVELVLDARQGVIAPEEALVVEAGAVHVFVLNADDRIERREVVVGGRRAGEAEIISGLEAGERVVTRGVQKVRDGVPARALQTEGALRPEARADEPAPSERADAAPPSGPSRAGRPATPAATPAASGAAPIRSAG
ncbi:membrane fusion protein, multidrug efflux system [Albimonas donghaensis]|uniref:Membrane fusion protein, multidrug efflux system n=1 Tax=Albimonas donghaensis TaxID=356660 RepID=A0A1H3F2E4_9RHOB|nr:efflux RND transporter periplasmic adaptor subunit [Albimonas donghaensis]SDX85142.1 membrane fusion protein, multidrug efflux system [Albimonas donghaensis]